MILRGKVHKYGANVDTDAIIPARYLNVSEPAELAQHCMEDIDQEFLNRMGPGDMIVAGDNFGCGSSREHAPVALKAAGVSCVIARSFARIFFRNAINIGLPLLECAEAVDNSEAGDSIEVDLESGRIKNDTKNMSFQAKPYPEFMMGIVNAGGLVEYTRNKLAGAK
jgi:3-isopropylmalate/(R)-2-methylmalate dehydratase small subunit